MIEMSEVLDIVVYNVGRRDYTDHHVYVVTFVDIYVVADHEVVPERLCNVKTCTDDGNPCGRLLGAMRACGTVA